MLEKDRVHFTVIFSSPTTIPGEVSFPVRPRFQVTVPVWDVWSVLAPGFLREAAWALGSPYMVPWTAG